MPSLRRSGSTSTTTSVAEGASPTPRAGVGNAARTDAAGLAGGQTELLPVLAGDTLWGIAARELGDGARWIEIAALNDLADPSRIYPGQILRVPVAPLEDAPTLEVDGPSSVAPAVAPPAPSDAPTLATAELGVAPTPAVEDAQARESSAEGGFWSRLTGAVHKAVSAVTGFFGRLFGGSGEGTPGREAPAVDSPSPSLETSTGSSGASSETDAVTDVLTDVLTDVEAEGPELEPAPQPVVHTVFPGDNLWTIAQQYLGDGARWREIADANGLENASLLRVGMELVIPGATPRAPITSIRPAPRPDTLTTPGSDDGLAASDPINRSGLRGLDHTMAGIYNSKGAYLQRKASELGISTAAAAAVLQIESGGRGFHSESGKMIIRFENHIFWGQWGSANPGTFREHFQFSSSQQWKGHKFRENPSDPWESFHGVQSKEWRVLELARSLDDTGALKSISMGAAQIMGFNYQTLGYASVQEMFASMSESLPAQLDGMFAFIQANNTCMNGLRSGNYTQFARGYNGPGQAEHYGGLIASAAASYARVTRGLAHA